MAGSVRRSGQSPADTYPGDPHPSNRDEPARAAEERRLNFPRRRAVNGSEMLPGGVWKTAFSLLVIAHTASSKGTSGGGYRASYTKEISSLLSGFGSLWSRRYLAGLLAGGAIVGGTSMFLFDRGHNRLILRNPNEPLVLDAARYWPTMEHYHRRPSKFIQKKPVLVCSERIPDSEQRLFKSMPVQETWEGDVHVDDYLYLNKQGERLETLVFECDLNNATFCCGMDCCRHPNAWEKFWKAHGSKLLLTFFAVVWVVYISVKVRKYWLHRKARQNVPTQPVQAPMLPTTSGYNPDDYRAEFDGGGKSGR